VSFILFAPQSGISALKKASPQNLYDPLPQSVPPPCQAPILSWRLLLIKNGRKKGGRGLGLAVTEAQVERVV